MLPLRGRSTHCDAVGGAGSVFAACAEPPIANDDGTAAAEFVKDPAPFIPHGSHNLETRLDRLDSFITPTGSFYLRNNSATPRIDAAAYSLSVEGAGIDEPITLSLDDLQAMPNRTVFAYVECGGNQRVFFDLVMGRAATGTQWGTGGVSMAEWTGVPLAEVLRYAGLRDDAVDVQLIGLDTESPEQGFRRSIPVAKALDPDTILAYRMNGVELPPDHGFPVRAITPGWVGSTNIKWLGRIEVATESIWSRNNTTSYVLIGDAYPPEGEAAGEVVRLQTIKSALALPWPARLAAGPQRLRGFAHSPHAPIAQVEWSIDDGASWQQAEIIPPVLRYSWVRFEITWDATAGSHTILTRATDASGETQPDEIPFNEKGYLFNLPLSHPVSVV